MPCVRYPRREPTEDWLQLCLLLKDPARIRYEIIRPMILFGVRPKERAEETSISRHTIYYKANPSDQASIFIPIPPRPLPLIPKLDKQAFPTPMLQAIVGLKAEYLALTIHELAIISYMQFE